MRGFRGGAERAAILLLRRILQNIYKKNTEMKVQMLFSGPLLPELGPRPTRSKLSGSAPVYFLYFRNKVYPHATERK